MNSTKSGTAKLMIYPPIRTVNELFLRVAGSNRPDAMLWQGEDGVWKGISSAEIYARVKALAGALLGWGIKRGDRIALISENRWEWQVTDFAVLAVGAVDVPIYPTLTVEQTSELLRDSGARIVIVSTRALYEKVQAARPGTSLERVVMMDSTGLAAEAISFAALMPPGRTESSRTGPVRDEEFDALLNSAKPEELATLIYTSGTTGEPKGVMLTHGNLASNTSLSTSEFGFSREDSAISYLPLSHITARALDYAMFFNESQVAYCGQFDKLLTALKEVRPTVLVGVPRVYEKVRHGVQQKSAASPVKRRILGWAVGIGAAHREAAHNRQRPASPAWKIADKLVYSKIREAFGGRVRSFISGGAPLGIDTGNWFASVGISVLEGYGLSETSPVIAINSPIHHRMGSVGLPLSNTECRLAADGELLVRGPGIFQGYWGKSRDAETFTTDGFFHTGDIAHIDNDGYLSITDRKKELLKTSGGKLIAPAPIESKLKTHMLIAEAAVVGDRHKFVSVLLSPNFAALEAWARVEGVEAQTRRELVAEPRVTALYEQIVDEVNRTLANFETMKRCKVVADEWTLASGELTPSMKLKRRVITERYGAEIADLYADEATARGE